MTKLILLFGIPCSSKSTWIKENKDFFDANVISSDNIRLELTNSWFVPERETEVWNTIMDRIIKLLKNGKSVILDSTNVNEKYRKILVFSILKEVGYKNIELFVKVFKCNPLEAIKRVNNRKYGSPVPSHVIIKMYTDYIKSIYKLEKEGFKNFLL